MAKADAYSTAIYIMAGLLVIGFISNLLVRPVDASHHYRADAEPEPVTRINPEPETAGIKSGAQA